MVDGICKPVDEGENGSSERQSDLPKVTQLNLEVGKKSGARERWPGREIDTHLSPSTRAWVEAGPLPW